MFICFYQIPTIANICVSKYYSLKYIQLYEIFGTSKYHVFLLPGMNREVSMTSTNAAYVFKIEKRVILIWFNRFGESYVPQAHLMVLCLSFIHLLTLFYWQRFLSQCGDINIVRVRTIILRLWLHASCLTSNSVWGRHHCRWRDAQCRPLLGTGGFWMEAAVTRGLGFCGLIRGTAP